MAYSNIIKDYIEKQSKRSDWNRNKIDGICGCLQYDKLSDGKYIIYNYKKNKVIIYGLDSLSINKPKYGWENKSCQHIIVKVWKNGKLNFFAPWISKDKLVLEKWADTYSPQCSIGNKFTLYFDGEEFQLNLDISPRLRKGSYNMWNVENVDY